MSYPNLTISPRGMVLTLLIVTWRRGLALNRFSLLLQTGFSRGDSTIQTSASSATATIKHISCKGLLCKKYYLSLLARTSSRRRPSE
ncbi:hypothetical protein GGR55DRAFT_671863, partial [Xylaria sp. FL0064]